MLALRDGDFDIEFAYQTRLELGPGGTSFQLPTPYGLVNRVALTVKGRDVDVTPRHPVSVERRFADGDTVADIVFSPVADAALVWKPRSRDVARENTVFYVELSQLYVPSAGVI